MKVNKWDLIKLKAFAQQRKPSTKQKYNLLNFLGDPVVQTQCFHCREHKFDPW